MATRRIQLNDKAIAQLPTPDKGRYIVRDSTLKGFFLLVGRRKKSFMIQGDLRQQGKRASTVRMTIGDSTEVSTRAARAVAREYLAQIGRGLHPRLGGRP